MAIFVFAYNSMVRQQNIEAHHSMIVETTDYIALSGLRLLNTQLEESFDRLIKADCPDLFSKPGSYFTGPKASVSLSASLCSKLQSDYQKILGKFTDLTEVPTCDSVGVRFSDIKTLTPNTRADQFASGRDPVEKCGNIEITCKISYCGLTRIATIKKQFRIISMVPGVFGRFTLFVSKTPYSDSYNAVGSLYTGKIDGTYSHPPGGNKIFKPLILINGTNTSTITAATGFNDSTKDMQDLQNNGWIFIGPSAESGGTVNLKIPSGFDKTYGGNFMIGKPNSLTKLAPEIINDHNILQPVAGHSYSVFGKYQGFYTCERGNYNGVGGKGIWKSISQNNRVEAASTWLFPYGNRQASTRTLILGKVLLGVLKFYYIKGKDSLNNPYLGVFSDLKQTEFYTVQSSSLKYSCNPWYGTPDPIIKPINLFVNGYNSYSWIMPFSTVPSLVSDGIAFNIIFDFMKYPPGTYSYPQLDGIPKFANYNKFFVPRGDAMKSCPIKGLYPCKTNIYFKKDEGYDPTNYPDNCFYSGDLSKLTVKSSNLNSNRISHIINLSDCTTTSQESKRLEQHLFKLTNGKSEPLKSGLLKIIRRPHVGTGPKEAITLSKRNINLTKNLILLFNKGDLLIKKDIESSSKDGSPQHLLTLALQNGNFYLDGDRKIDAFLISISNTDGTGKILQLNDNHKLNINGGLALKEIGLYKDHDKSKKTTMYNFRSGGILKYNPRFNPVSSNYANSYVYVADISSSKLTLKGGD